MWPKPQDDWCIHPSTNVLQCQLFFSFHCISYIAAFKRSRKLYIPYNVQNLQSWTLQSCLFQSQLNYDWNPFLLTYSNAKQVSISLVGICLCRHRYANVKYHSCWSSMFFMMSWALIYAFVLEQMCLRRKPKRMWNQLVNFHIYSYFCNLIIILVGSFYSTNGKHFCSSSVCNVRIWGIFLYLQCRNWQIQMLTQQDICFTCKLLQEGIKKNKTKKTRQQLKKKYRAWILSTSVH